jgi:hypothetical protein
VALVNNHATLVRDGKPLVEHIGIDFSGLTEAEAAVAALAGSGVTIAQGGELAVARIAADRAGPSAPCDVAQAVGFELPASATPDAIAGVRRRLRALADQWRALDDGAAIKLTFSRPAT